MSVKCLITGCDLIIEAEGKWVHGDLHELSKGILIFNAVLTEQGKCAWKYQGQQAVRKNSNQILLCADYFERRGVITFSKADCSINQAAFDYLKGAF